MRYLHELKTRKEVIDFLGVCSSKLAKAMKDGGGFNVNGVVGNKVFTHEFIVLLE